MVGDSPDIPDEFDWTTKNPGCTSEVKNQGQCGSCWAVSGSTAFADRLCINSGINVVLSAQNLVDCDHFNANGCKGAQITSAWQ